MAMQYNATFASEEKALFWLQGFIIYMDENVIYFNSVYITSVLQKFSLSLHAIIS